MVKQPRSHALPIGLGLIVFMGLVLMIPIPGHHRTTSNSASFKKDDNYYWCHAITAGRAINSTKEGLVPSVSALVDKIGTSELPKAPPTSSVHFGDWVKQHPAAAAAALLSSTEDAPPSLAVSQRTLSDGLLHVMLTGRTPTYMPSLHTAARKMDDYIAAHC